MLYLSVALSFLGSLAFLSFRSWVKHQGELSQFQKALDSATTVLRGQYAELEARADETDLTFTGHAEMLKGHEDRLKKAAEATGITAASFKVAIDQLASRVRGCELKASIKGQSRNPLQPEAVPDPVGFERVG